MKKAAIADPALQAISEIVHDIDLKDAKFARKETHGIANLIARICAANTQDEQRIAQGGPVFDNLYQYFRATRA
ncbi:chromate resistance protein ChrB domain-containing protein [Ensifer sp. 2TAB8]|uniref:chromate resistance protein ChrB domain-containing protein n=1 Tax=Ensifer sp. 2TAB8 TaxID=3233006 RepID=UPI0025C516A8|nr:chromate resistance protein ChrB domain-containing protein [Ensifer sp. SSB1]